MASPWLPLLVVLMGLGVAWGSAHPGESGSGVSPAIVSPLDCDGSIVMMMVVMMMTTAKGDARDQRPVSWEQTGASINWHTFRCQGGAGGPGVAVARRRSRKRCSGFPCSPLYLQGFPEASGWICCDSSRLPSHVSTNHSISLFGGRLPLEGKCWI